MGLVGLRHCIHVALTERSALAGGTVWLVVCPANTHVRAESGLPCPSLPTCSTDESCGPSCRLKPSGQVNLWQSLHSHVTVPAWCETPRRVGLQPGRAVGGVKLACRHRRSNEERGVHRGRSRIQEPLSSLHAHNHCLCHTGWAVALSAAHLGILGSLAAWARSHMRCDRSLYTL